VPPPIWREWLAGAELAALLRAPVWRGEGVAAGEGAPVLLLPGFLAGDRSMGLLAGWLHRAGYRPRRARMLANGDCAGRTLRRLERHVREEVASSGRRVAIIGQSRGGSLARALAAREPQLISGIITLGSPLRDQLAVHPALRAVVRGVATLGDAGVPGVLSSDCQYGPCCARFYEDVVRPFPSDVGFVSIYSRSDGLIDWRACRDPDAEHVEVVSSHLGMAAHPASYRAIAAALPSFWPPAEVVRFARSG
jgi:pimeloyl-ACP methyl ester carboxylesterase